MDGRLHDGSAGRQRQREAGKAQSFEEFEAYRWCCSGRHGNVPGDDEPRRPGELYGLEKRGIVAVRSIRIPAFPGRVMFPVAQPLALGGKPMGGGRNVIASLVRLW